MPEFETRTYMNWLWAITFIGIGGGVLIWVMNFLRETTIRNLSARETQEVLLSVALWQGIAGSLVGFGAFVLVITLATSALVTASASSK